MSLRAQFDRYNAERRRFSAEYTDTACCWAVLGRLRYSGLDARHAGGGHADIQAPLVVVPYAIFNQSCYDRDRSDRRPAGNTKLAPEFSSSSPRADRLGPTDWNRRSDHG